MSSTINDLKTPLPASKELGTPVPIVSNSGDGSSDVKLTITLSKFRTYLETYDVLRFLAFTIRSDVTPNIYSRYGYQDITCEQLQKDLDYLFDLKDKYAIIGQSVDMGYFKSYQINQLKVMGSMQPSTPSTQGLDFLYIAGMKSQSSTAPWIYFGIHGENGGQPTHHLHLFGINYV